MKPTKLIMPLIILLTLILFILLLTGCQTGVDKFTNSLGFAKTQTQAEKNKEAQDALTPENIADIKKNSDLYEPQTNKPGTAGPVRTVRVFKPRTTTDATPEKTGFPEREGCGGEGTLAKDEEGDVCPITK